MSFSLAGTVITQTGTDTSLAGLSGISGVTVTSTSTGMLRYYLNDRRLVVSGSLIIDGDFEILEFAENCPFPNLDRQGTLQIGRKRTNGGKVRYSSGTPIIFNRQGTNDSQSQSQGAMIGNASNDFIGYGGLIISGLPISFGGKLNSTQGGSIDIESLGIYFRANTQGNAGQLRFDTSTGSAVNVSGLELDCDPNTTGRSIILFATDYQSFSAVFKNYSLQSFVSQPKGLRFDNLQFANNFSDRDLVSNSGGEVFALVDCDKGSSCNIFLQSNNAHHWAFYGQPLIKTQDTSANNLSGAQYYIADVDDGQRFSPIGNTTDISSLMTNYGTTGSNVYSGGTNASGEATPIVLMSTHRTDGSGGFDHADYSNGGSLSDSFTVYVYKYGYNLSSQSQVLRNNGGTPVNYLMTDDLSITESSKAVVDGYGFTVAMVSGWTVTGTTTATQLYDKIASYMEDNFNSTEFRPSRNNNQLNFGALDVTIDATQFTGGIETTGDVFLDQAMTLTGGTFDRIIIKSGFGGDLTLDNCDVTTVRNESGSPVNIILVNGSSIPATQTPSGSLTIINDMTVTISGLQVGDQIRVEDNTGAQQEYQTATGTTYQFNITRDNQSEVWKLAVDRAGYSPFVQAFTVNEGTSLEFVSVLNEYLRAAGSVMYEASTSPLVNISFDLVTPQATIDIGDGAVTPQIIFDEFEQALLTSDGMAWHSQQGTIVTHDDLPGVGPILFLQSNVRVRRETAGDVNATVSGYMLSSDGTPVDGSNGSVGFIGGLSTDTLAQAVDDLLSANHGAGSWEGGGAGGDDAATIYTYFTGSNREDAFKADVSNLSTQVSVDAIPTNTLLTNDARLDNLDATISSRSTFDHTSDQVVASNMRGTDGANTVAPDNATIAAIQSSVSNIPTNTLLTNDVRLDRLDANVSSRSTFDPSLDEVTTDAASREASKATGFSTHSEGDVVSAMQTVADDFKADVSGLATQISVDTIPTNTLRDDDPRLDSYSTFDHTSDQVVASNMRGTDGANMIAPDNATIAAISTAVGNIPTDPLLASNYTAPDNASIAQILADTNELQQNQGDWATATGFSTAADVNNARDAILTEGGNSWTTATGYSTHNAGDVVTAMQTVANDFKADVSALATQASVNMIPQNPLLTNDARLDHLDAAISTRSTFNASTDEVTVKTNNDKTNYSLANNSITSSVVADNALNNQAFTTGYFNEIESKAGDALTAYDAATATDVTNARDAVLLAISGLPTTGDISALQAVLDLLLKYNDNTTAFIGANGVSEVEQPEAHFIVVYDDDGTTELKRIALQNVSGISVPLLNATRYVKV